MKMRINLMNSLILAFCLLGTLKSWSQEYTHKVQGPGNTEMTLKVNGPIEISEISPTGFKISVDVEAIKQGKRIIPAWSKYLNYYGDWTSPPDENCTGCCCSFSRNAVDSMTYHFKEATEINFYGEVAPHHGILDIYLDNIKQATIDTYSAVPNDTVLHWSRKDLDPGKTYVLKIQPAGEKHPDSTGEYAVVRHFEMYNRPQTSDPDPDPKPPVVPISYKFVYINGSWIIR